MLSVTLDEAGSGKRRNLAPLERWYSVIPSTVAIFLALVSWAGAFWVNSISKASARAAGQRKVRFIACTPWNRYSRTTLSRCFIDRTVAGGVKWKKPLTVRAGCRIRRRSEFRGGTGLPRRPRPPERSNPMKRRMLAGALLLACCGCSSMNNTEAGALGGGLIGGALGTIVGAACHNPLAGAAIGAAGGAGVGALAGHAEDRAEKRE